MGVATPEGPDNTDSADHTVDTDGTDDSHNGDATVTMHVRTEEGPRMTQPFEAQREIEVLLVEDDPGDVLMTREAFQDYKVHNQLHVVQRR